MRIVEAGNLHHTKAKQPGKLGNHHEGQDEEPEFGATRASGKHRVIAERILQ